MQQKYREVFYSIFWVEASGNLVTSGDDFASESEAHAFADKSEDDRDYLVMAVHVRRVVQNQVVRQERARRHDDDQKKTTTKNTSGK